jgi:hypothetical protein
MAQECFDRFTKQMNNIIIVREISAALLTFGKEIGIIRTDVIER